MLVAIRVAVLAVREIIVFLLKTGWRFGKFCLGLTMLTILFAFQFFNMGAELRTHALENMCATSLL